MYGWSTPTITRRKPLVSPGSPPVATWNSPPRLTSNASAPALAEHLELQACRVAERDARDGEVASSAAREAGGEAGPVVVLDGLALVTHLDVRVPDNGAQRHRPGRDGGGQRRPGDRLDRAEQELGDIGEVAAEVGERAGAGPTAVAPADRRMRVAAVVGPVLRR